MNITIVGTGYVGLSNAVLLSQTNKVIALDIDPKKVEKINNRISPIEDKEISEYFEKKNLNLMATLDEAIAYKDSDFVLISTPTDYNDITNSFDTNTVRTSIKRIRALNKKCIIIVKSTVPIGFTQKIINDYNDPKIVFSPEFLREGHALYDNLYPSRIIFGFNMEDRELYNGIEEFCKTIKKSIRKPHVKIIYMNATEAESVKLFSNTYLASRVAFFNEVDTFAELNNLSSKSIISGMSFDDRIGNHYNNPSFGYGGYCLPKDTKQLLSNYENVPNSMIKAIVESNSIRKMFVADSISREAENIKTKMSNSKIFKIGMYRLNMKMKSDNFRQSSIIDVMDILKDRGYTIIVYEPAYHEEKYKDFVIVNEFDEFVKDSDLIVANRFEEKLKTVEKKVYTRDIFCRD